MHHCVWERRSGDVELVVGEVRATCGLCVLVKAISRTLYEGLTNSRERVIKWSYFPESNARRYSVGEDRPRLEHAVGEKAKSRRGLEPHLLCRPFVLPKPWINLSSRAFGKTTRSTGQMILRLHPWSSLNFERRTSRSVISFQRDSGSTRQDRKPPHFCIRFRKPPCSGIREVNPGNHNLRKRIYSQTFRGWIECSIWMSTIRSILYIAFPGAFRSSNVMHDAIIFILIA